MSEVPLYVLHLSSQDRRSPSALLGTRGAGLRVESSEFGAWGLSNEV